MPSTSGTWLGTGTSVEGSNRLGTLVDEFQQTSMCRNAQPLTVRFRGAHIAEDLDHALRGTNDLMMVTKFQFGNEPPVDRLHYLGKDDPIGWHGDFFRDVVLSVRDLTKTQLTVRLQIYDIDGVASKLIDSIEQFSRSAAVAFPQLSPYAGMVGLGIRPVVELVNNIDDHDEILDQRVTLEIAEPGTRHKLLQPGYFVAFGDDVDGQLRLGRDLKVSTEDGTEYTDCSYAVLEVAREFIGEEDWEITQKAAKLIAELNGKGQSEKDALDFLKDTIKVYTEYRRLNRANDLLAKDTLTEDEEALLEDLRSDPELRAFLGGD